MLWKRLTVPACLLAGCMTLPEKPTASSTCSFDQVWELSTAALADFQFETLDQTSGVIETNWVEVEASRQAGALQRDVNKERVRYIVEIKPDGNGIAANVL